MSSAAEWAWAAGLFEGEGWIVLNDRGDLGGYVHCGLTTTDEDVLRRFHSIVRVGRFSGPYIYPNRPDHLKPRWTWLCMRHADIEGIAREFWPWLGDRRRERFQTVVTAAEHTLGARRKPWTIHPWDQAQMELAS